MSKKEMIQSAPDSMLEGILEARKGQTTELLAAFDALPAASMEQMIGQWTGFEIESGHPMDGYLEATGWYGKRFVSAEEVHPLLFSKGTKGACFSVNPLFMPMKMAFPKTKALRTVMQVIRPIVQTTKGTARLRMIAYRGKLTATMAYDRKPINDHFASINENTVLGVMDHKGDEKPYFFVLEREKS